MKELRNEQGLTITRLATLSGLTQNAVSRIERGHRSPSAITVQKLARGLAVEPGALFEPVKKKEAS